MRCGPRCNGLQWKWLRTAINRNLGPDYLHLSIPSGRDYLQLRLLLSSWDCNQRIFRTTLSASISDVRTTLSASETAISGTRLQSATSGRHYLHLTGLTTPGHLALLLDSPVLVRSTRMEHRRGDSFCVSIGCLEV